MIAHKGDLYFCGSVDGGLNWQQRYNVDGGAERELMIQPLRKVIVDKAKNPVLAPLEREGHVLGFQSFVWRM